jgi:hypothetical protein
MMKESQIESGEDLKAVLVDGEIRCYIHNNCVEVHTQEDLQKLLEEVELLEELQ